MQDHSGHKTAGGAAPRRLYVYNGGFLFQKRVRRVLQLSGYTPRLGLPRTGDWVGVWGRSPTAHRGEGIAEKYGTPLLRVEDAFLRSMRPGRAGEHPIGLHLDTSGAHFDASTPSDLEQILARNPLDNTALLDRARGAIARIQDAHLSKYNDFDPADPAPEPGYVLVIDQTRDDASVIASRAGRAEFLEMLVFAQEEHPGARIIIKSHPETPAGYRPGYFNGTDTNNRITMLDAPISPWLLFEGAIGVYTVSSQMGFEAIMAGHKPRIFGQPFYAGWGLTADQNPVPRRARNLTRAQLFAAAMILYPVWYDPCRDRLCQLETVLDTLEAQARAWRADRDGWVASGMRLWKRAPLQKMYGNRKKLLFEDSPAQARELADKTGRNRMVWASKAGPEHGGATRVEDGFLRSRGLGAELVPALSLVTDGRGIYYDPSRPSDLEQWIARREKLRPDQRMRAEKLVQSIISNNISKYNLGTALPNLPELPKGPRILVPGQVEDDASILLGTGKIRTNRDLVAAVRAARPDAVIIYKPHPDVDAGLRQGGAAADQLADIVAPHADPLALLAQVNEVWTMTSLLGFEAILRGIPVVTLGAPFYAGWGLTEDRGAIPPRRKETVSLAGLAHAALIDYPRYFDPLSQTACPPEMVIERLATGRVPHPGTLNRLLSRLQGIFASQSRYWR